MSRRLAHYRHLKAETVAATASAIMHVHRFTKNIGHTKIGVFMSDTSVINQYVPSSLPIKPEKAERLAQALHHARS